MATAKRIGRFDGVGGRVQFRLFIILRIMLLCKMTRCHFIENMDSIKW